MLNLLRPLMLQKEGLDYKANKKTMYSKRTIIFIKSTFNIHATVNSRQIPPYPFTSQNKTPKYIVNGLGHK